MSHHDIGVGDACVAAVFLLWFLISIPHQFTNRIGEPIKRINTLAIIPGWTFFAPNPGKTDYRFVYRDIVPDGRTAWAEVDWCGKRRLLDAVWHPRRHRTKVLVDCVSGLVRTVDELRKRGVPADERMPGWMISVPYLALLNIVVQMPRLSEAARSRQFAIVEQDPTDPSAPGRMVVCSAEHDL